MRLKALLFGLIMTWFGCLGVVPATGQGQDDDVRGAFLTTRPKPVPKGSRSNENKRPNRRRPKAGEAKPPGSPPASDTGSGKTNEPNPSTQKIGLGLTLFSRDSLGLAVRVDPTHVFHKGDRVRILLETNADGYLYIFNTTDGGKPVMIYPDKELDEGGNYILSHIPFEIPSSAAAEERLRWLVFNEYAGTERLFFVFRRSPLPGVPIEDDLLKYCQENEKQCPWKPGPELWTQIQKELNAPVQVATTARYGKAQTTAEQEAASRGLGLSKDEPAPSLIMMTASSNSGTLVTALDLIHK